MENGSCVVGRQGMYVGARAGRVDATLQPERVSCRRWRLHRRRVGAFHDADGPTVQSAVAAEGQLKWLAARRVCILEAHQRAHVAEHGESMRDANQSWSTDTSVSSNDGE